MNFNFGEVLSRAWKITWKYKILWIFGILSSCSRGGGGSSGGGNGGDGNGYNPFGSDVDQFFTQTGDWLSQYWWVVALIVAAVFALVLLSIFLGAIGRIGLIRGTLQAEEGAEQLSFGELFKGSLPYFWRVFGLTFLIGLISLLALLPFFAFGVLTAGIGFLCLLPLFCLLIPVSIALSLIIEMANVAIVKENVGLVDGFKRGWEVVRGNAGPVIVMGLILLAISFVLGLLIAIPILMIILPAGISVALNQGQSMTPLLIGGLCFVMFLPVAILVSGILNAFLGASWTLTYLRLTSKPEAPVVVLPEANA
ncbi:MAG: hypothetical protein DYG87_02170 [Anaerolineae bacterium CFX3]|jgi:hypothetical protein|nr:hypothetical protein [Anaerolineales bacterium]MCE7904587.1 hypothetical protein [Anaerolineae bacterium CFX3]MCQ3945617.1 hypothetical protein [Anaerolineae bacterium]OQY81676.1 MAG: hypothetical protein B6D40_10510 [Anaerolineae bacterium UTCFX3]MCZ2287399.1 hypothetical protein [Anaerolineales bacterium]